MNYVAKRIFGDIIPIHTSCAAGSSSNLLLPWNLRWRTRAQHYVAVS